MRILVSACLLGRNCKYNGGNNLDEKVLAFVRGHETVPVCPEEPLGVPRAPMELRDGRLVSKDGRAVDAIVRGSVAEILARLEGQTIHCAVLKSRSPTCGVRQVYDGTFSGKRIDGMGLLAQALREKGIPVIDAEDLE